MSVFLAFFTCHTLLAQQPDRSRVLTAIEAGTIIGNSEAPRWNRIVLLARPKISSGDVKMLSSSIRESVSLFVLSVLATVENYTDANSGEDRYRLTEVGVGYSAELEGSLKVITLESASKLGLSLGFVERQLLHENEKQLKKVQLVARTSTLTIFDTPAIVLRDGKHQDFIMRHFIWIDSRTGEAAALVWLLDQNAAGEKLVVNEPIRQLPSGFKENRGIHVDGSEFTLGFPSERAFSLESLPPGKPLAWSSASKSIAARNEYTMDELRELSVALNGVLHSAKSN